MKKKINYKSPKKFPSYLLIITTINTRSKFRFYIFIHTCIEFENYYEYQLTNIKILHKV